MWGLGYTDGGWQWSSHRSSPPTPLLAQARPKSGNTMVRPKSRAHCTHTKPRWRKGYIQCSAICNPDGVCWRGRRGSYDSCASLLLTDEATGFMVHQTLGSWRSQPPGNAHSRTAHGALLVLHSHCWHRHHCAADPKVWNVAASMRSCREEPCTAIVVIIRCVQHNQTGAPHSNCKPTIS